MDTNVKSVFFSIQAIEPVMREGGSIILNTAWLNQVGVPGARHPFGLEGGGALISRTLSAELLGRRIRVNAVSPGLIETPILRGVGRSEHPGQSEAEFRDYLAGASKLIPIGRLGRPDEIATAPVTHPANNLDRKWSSTADSRNFDVTTKSLRSDVQTCSPTSDFGVATFRYAGFTATILFSGQNPCTSHQRRRAVNMDLSNATALFATTAMRLHRLWCPFGEVQQDLLLSCLTIG
jgi:Enoyl-(Acyl carrier protein) reductase